MHIIQAGMEIDVLKANSRIAHENYHLLKAHKIKSVDFMGSIGAGKTALIIEMGKRLVAEGKKVCVIAGDVTGDDDFKRFQQAGLDAVNCNTGKECHLDANLVKKSLATMDLDKYDIVIVENVGNLVCPADPPCEPITGRSSCRPPRETTWSGNTTRCSSIPTLPSSTRWT